MRDAGRARASAQDSSGSWVVDALIAEEDDDVVCLVEAFLPHLPRTQIASPTPPHIPRPHLPDGCGWGGGQMK